MGFSSVILRVHGGGIVSRNPFLAIANESSTIRVIVRRKSGSVNFLKSRNSETLTRLRPTSARQEAEIKNQKAEGGGVRIETKSIDVFILSGVARKFFKFPK